jgi:uncharacterized protein YjiS (DUF1127 family)
MSNEHTLLGHIYAAARPANIMADGGRAASPQLDAETAAGRLRARVRRVVIRRAVKRMTRLLRLWRRRTTESNEFRLMSDRELWDLGIHRHEADYEAKKAFWRQGW